MKTLSGVECGVCGGDGVYWGGEVVGVGLCFHTSVHTCGAHM